MPSQLSKPKRTPRAKVAPIPEPALAPPPVALTESASEPTAAGKKKPALRPKASKDSDKDKAKKPVKEAPVPKAVRAKKAKAE
jgi:hypothetical protein